MSCFKAYDIRGRLPDELNADQAWKIGRAYAEYIQPQKVVVGRDVRLSSAELCDALSKGLAAGGVDVYDIGLCGTEEIYFATSDQKMDGGIMVTASHNPMDYNGMKLVREGSRPISGDTGLRQIEEMVAQGEFGETAQQGEIKSLDVRARYIDHLLSYINTANLKPLKIVINAGNGCAGPVMDELEEKLPVEWVKVHHQPDGHFPNGIPNPLLPENRSATSEAVVANQADLGIAWDGDFDRCFLFDEKGQFIEGYYIVGLLAQAFLNKHAGAKIIHDPRLTWNTVDVVNQAGGIPVMSKTGHAFIKERMRSEDAVYGGEMSAHHYFKDFAYCDSGMIPWLLVLELISVSGKPLSELVSDRISKFPASGEINRRIEQPDKAMAKVQAVFEGQALVTDFTDGLSMDFSDWRFNLRMSNTEPVVRLNVESRANFELMREKTDMILALLD